jgi:hypothetical protein
MYKSVVGNGWVTPRDFWHMHPQEVFWLIDAKKPVKMFGNMTEDEAEELYRQQYG